MYFSSECKLYSRFNLFPNFAINKKKTDRIFCYPYANSLPGSAMSMPCEREGTVFHASKNTCPAGRVSEFSHVLGENYGIVKQPSCA